MDIPAADAFVRRGRRLLSAHWGLIIVLGVALAFRIAYLQWFKAFPPGDVFNFINIAEGLPRGHYDAGEKRLPFYPLLLLATHGFLDWEPAGLVVAVGASLASLVLLYALGRTLRFSNTSLAVVLLVFQAQPQFLIASTRGYADTTFIALVLGSLLALLSTRTWKGGILTGALLGFSALTRYEGGTVAALLLPLWILLPRRLPRRVPLVALAAFVITLVPYVALAFVNGRPVVGAGYFAEAKIEAGYGAPGIRTFVNNGLEMWRRIGLVGFWNIPLGIVREISLDPFGTPRILSNRLTEPGYGMTLFSVLGLLLLLWWRKWRELLLVAAAYLGATLPAAWYHPFQRYDIYIMPATTLFAAAGFNGIQALVVRGTLGRSGRTLRVLLAMLALTVVGGFWMANLAERTRDMQKKHNGREYAFYQAIHAARALPGKIAFPTDADIVRIYFRERAFFLSPTDNIARIRNENVSYAVVSASHARRYPFLEEPPFERVRSFEWPQGNSEVSRASIYQRKD